MDTKGYEWSPRPPNMRERIISGVLLIALVSASASWYAGWRLFGDYDKAVLLGIAIVATIVFTRFMPTVRRR